MIRRAIQDRLVELSRRHPVVALTGPRGAGKRTLAREAFPGFRLVDLEDPAVRQAAEADPRGFLETDAPPAILAEAQNAPALLGHVRTLLAGSPDCGRYVLTCSRRPPLEEEVSRSLAEMTGSVRLLPPAMAELAAAGIGMERDEYLVRGFLPGNQGPGAGGFPYREYLSDFLEREARTLPGVGDLELFRLFMMMLAGRIGRLVDLPAFSGDIGVAPKNLEKWISFLEDCFLVCRLPSYQEKFGKRLVRGTKVYFTEVGLAAWLLGIEAPDQAFDNPLFGALFENLVVMEAMKTRLNAGKPPDLFFLRLSQGIEAKLLFRKAPGELVPIEIRSGRTWNPDFCRNLRRIHELSERFTLGFVIYSGELTPNFKGVKYLNYRQTADALQDA